MNEFIKIGCPRCGSVLTVKNQQGIEFKKVTCPECKYKSLFSDFRQMSINNEKTTNYSNENKVNDDPPTDLNLDSNFMLGELRILNSDVSFQLKIGKNIIGRKATVSTATIQIPCETRRMSREHLVIEVKKKENRGFGHYVSVFKEKVNPTYIGKIRLEYGDCIVLHDGDIIKLPDLDIQFIIPDQEKTEL